MAACVTTVRSVCFADTRCDAKVIQFADDQKSWFSEFDKVPHQDETRTFHAVYLMLRQDLNLVAPAPQKSMWAVAMCAFLPTSAVPVTMEGLDTFARTRL